MRARSQAHGVTLKAYAGTSGVMLAFDLPAEARAGLLGFAIEREGGNRPRHWLEGLARFPGDRASGPVPSNLAPLQRFRWSDYRVYPGTRYGYTVHPVRGDARRPEVLPGPTVEVTTASVSDGAHRIVFNRAAAASQAFARGFPEVAVELDAARRERRAVRLPPRALAWLSRGALEQITGFCARALDPTWALDVAIYELELPAIVDALAAARERGAEVRIVYHARAGDPQTEENERALAGWPASSLRPRVTSRICHDKFMVLSRIEDRRRVPASVLCGSTNFTENGVYRQANVVHTLEREDVADRYRRLFEVLFAGASRAATRDWIDEHVPLGDGPLVVGFNPRRGEDDLALFVAEIGRVERDVLFCTAFDLDDRIAQALLGAPNDPTLRFGLENRRSSITGVHRDRTADFTATAFLGGGLEGWLKESTAGQRGNILIHTKLVVLDFTSDAPTVISGSHNLSAAASGGNDENFLVIRGDAEVADCYGVELMRLYDHYRFRWHRKQGSDGAAAADPCPRPAGTLCPDDRWTARYFEAGSLAEADRLRFSGTDAA
jgi:hypothetical protein